MAGKRKNVRKAAPQKDKMNSMEMRVLQRNLRQVYIWRYSVEENAKKRQQSGAPAETDAHGYNLLAPARPEKTDAAYTVATNTPMHWQVVAIAYCRDAEGEAFRLWAWARSGTPIKAAGSGIQPLLHSAHEHCESDLGEDETCDARAVIMAPWDTKHPIRPELLAGKLKARLHLTDHEIRELSEWGEPVADRVSEDALLDLEIASALRESDA